MGIKFKQATARAVLVDKQAFVKNRDPVGRWQTIGDDTHPAIGRTHTDPLTHHLGRVHIASAIKSHIIRANNGPPVGGNDFMLPGLGINGGHLITHGLGHVEPAIGAKLNAIGTEQGAGWRHMTAAPAFGQFRLASVLPVNSGKSIHNIPL